MSSLKSFMIVAALLTGGTSLAIAQSGRPTPPAAGATAGNPAPALKRQCVGIRHGLTECRTMQKSANSNSANSNGTSQMATSPTTPLHGSDTVILSAAQRRAVRNDLTKQASNQNVAGFDAAIGTFVPNNVKIEPMPSKVTANNPSLRPYGFAMVDHKLVIADPSNKVIADVLSK
jgi:hypothetical protein